MTQLPANLLAELRKTLDGEKARIAARISELHAQDPFTNPDRINDNAASDAEASEESSHDRFVAMVEELEGKLTDVTAALARMDDGAYGVCSSCGNPIEPERLRILPSATLCLSCEHKK